MTDKEILEVLRNRADGIKRWLELEHPLALAEQKHTEEATTERTYWHFGYMQAIYDILRKFGYALESRKPSASVEQEAIEWAKAQPFLKESVDPVGTIWTDEFLLAVRAYAAGHSSGAEKGRELAGMVIAHDEQGDDMSNAAISRHWELVLAKAREVKGSQ